MGFKVQRKTYKLRFQGTDLDGLVVVARSLTTGQLLELESARLARAEGGKGSEGATQEMVRLLADALVEWNADDENGQPIPPTLEGLLSQDSDFSMAIINAWQEAVVGARAPLSQTSSDGQPSALEASIPMDVPSESLAS
jgi:hypothetical protein